LINQISFLNYVRVYDDLLSKFLIIINEGIPRKIPNRVGGKSIKSRTDQTADERNRFSKIHDSCLSEFRKQSESYRFVNGFNEFLRD
jgi:hypothetical protein